MSKQTYDERKEAAREKIHCLLLYLEVQPASVGDLAEIQAKIEKLAYNNGLVGELKAENIL